MKLEQTIIHKTFVVKLRGNTYYVDFIDSDGQTLKLLNRNNWEVYNKDHNELDIYSYYEEDKKRMIELNKNRKLSKKLIDFCLKNFNSD